MFEQWARAIEKWRLQKHFEHAEHVLLANNTTLSPEVESARQQHIQNLREYRESGIFPRNYNYRKARPCFIDREGRVCAVGHLLISSGQNELAHKIAIMDNDAFVSDMQFSELLTWAQSTGLTKDELATIQPSYTYEMAFNQTLSQGLPYLIALIPIGFICTLANLRNIRQKRPTVVESLIAIGCAILLLIPTSGFVSILLQEIDRRIQVPDYFMMVQPVPDEIFAAMIVFALVTSLLCLIFFVVALRGFFQARHLLREISEPT